MNLNGAWKGKYTYGKGYPLLVRGRSEPFQLEIEDNDGIFSGTCIDNIVKKIPGNQSTIEGVFKDNYVSFLKKYRHHSFITDPNEAFYENFQVKFNDIHYTGSLFKRFFTGKKYFKGEWTITTEFTNKKTNELIVDTVEGTWRMEKA